MRIRRVQLAEGHDSDTVLRALEGSLSGFVRNGSSLHRPGVLLHEQLAPEGRKRIAYHYTPSRVAYAILACLLVALGIACALTLSRWFRAHVSLNGLIALCVDVGVWIVGFAPITWIYAAVVARGFAKERGVLDALLEFV